MLSIADEAELLTIKLTKLYVHSFSRGAIPNPFGSAVISLSPSPQADLGDGITFSRTAAAASQGVPDCIAVSWT